MPRISVVRTSVLDKMLKDPDWSRKLRTCASAKEYLDLIEEFCRAKDIKVLTVQ